MALEWFEPELLSSDTPDDCPLWMDDYTEFMTELQQNFGPHDPQGDAEVQLDKLQMRDGHCINKYIVEFQRLASQDKISHVGKPDSLSKLKALAQTIDTHYWERKGEVSRESKPTSSSYATKQSTSTSSSGQSLQHLLPPIERPISLLPVHLPPKAQTYLTSWRCLEKKLCLFCGGHGHSAQDCTKSTSHAAKARAAIASPSSTPEAKPGVSSEAKK
ncbi:hypothetical protein AZE42_10227 [Rhizopogon vesiculosus]|uniref:CCHC-type domain-containing protein n=1 Tax=Rhizopogon vesiculosus TaxID=180088 RepID=A0A1J8PJV6_9AGAM|nr:hypothetical protein AZE42_10227 [Rhizopogon vesiculosus]